jgi:predicted metalloprotease
LMLRFGESDVTRNRAVSGIVHLCFLLALRHGNAW